MAFKSLNGLSSMGPVSVTISTPDKTELFSKLFHARDVIHLAHLKTKGSMEGAMKTINRMDQLKSRDNLFNVDKN